MKYRRNADTDLRNAERALQAENSLANLELYNVARLRAGLLPLVPLDLEFGYNAGLPESFYIDGHNYTTATAAWGARAILENGQASLLPDRQSIVATSDAQKQTLIQVLNGEPRGTGAISEAQKTASRLFRRRDIDPAESKEVVLYDGNLIRVVANTNASHGYLYIVAYLKMAGMSQDSLMIPNKPCEQCEAELDPGEDLEECYYCHKLICTQCGTRCPDCQEFICEDHPATRCKHCATIICGSQRCNRRGGPSFSAKECPKCGEMYCGECRGEIKNCPCVDDLCKECGDELEECSECGEEYCSCKPCSCHEEEEDEEYEDNPSDLEGDDDDEDEDDLELGGWAVVHESGDLIADGFASASEAQEWLQQTLIEGLLDDAPESYHVTLVED